MYLSEQLAENIRCFRKKKGMTQLELANALHISAQSVSKWELGQTMPDVENLCALAKLLRVSSDQLLGIGSEPVLLGVDGGGSKTEFLLFTQAGRILGRLTLGPCNPNAVGLDGCLAVLREGIDGLIKNRSNLFGVFVGASGFFTGGNGKKVQAALRSAYPGVLFECQSDIRNVIAAGTESDSCAAVICGTGSVLFVKKGDTLTQLTGWGYLLSKGGSGYDIGRDVLRAALEDAQGLGPHTQLTSLVEARLGASAEHCIFEVYQHDQSYVAAFAPLAFRAYENGDPVAADILQKQAQELARVIDCAVKQHQCGGTVILSGGLITGSEVFSRMVTERLSPAADPVILQVPQIIGACRLCAKLCGLDTAKLTALLYQEYKKLCNGGLSHAEN